MSLENLTPASGSTKTAGKRLGRGQASGKGGTAARGHKGAKSRSGYSKKLVLKEVKCLYNDVFQNLVLKTSIVKNTRNQLDTLQQSINDKKVKKNLLLKLLNSFGS